MFGSLHISVPYNAATVHYWNPEIRRQLKDVSKMNVSFKFCVCKSLQRCLSLVAVQVNSWKDNTFLVSAVSKHPRVPNGFDKCMFFKGGRTEWHKRLLCWARHRVEQPQGELHSLFRSLFGCLRVKMPSQERMVIWEVSCIFSWSGSYPERTRISAQELS